VCLLVSETVGLLSVPWVLWVRLYVPLPGVWTGTDTPVPLGPSPSLEAAFLDSSNTKIMSYLPVVRELFRAKPVWSLGQLYDALQVQVAMPLCATPHCLLW
jgi:hypothetical protein